LCDQKDINLPAAEQLSLIGVLARAVAKILDCMELPRRLIEIACITLAKEVAGFFDVAKNDNR